MNALLDLFGTAAGGEVASAALQGSAALHGSAVLRGGAVAAGRMPGRPAPEESPPAPLVAGPACDCCRSALRSGRAPAARKRLWEIAQVHHCLLLGAAFDVRELRQAFRRAGLVGWEGAEDYGLHSNAVHHARERSDFSRVVHKMLEERYAGAVTRFKAARSPQEVLGLWRQSVSRGDPVSAYWAALTHPDCDAEASEVLFREMHMLAHNAFAARRADTRRILALEKQMAEIEEARARAHRQCEALRRETARLRAEAEAARQEARETAGAAAQLRAVLEQWERGEAVETLNTDLRAATAERDAARSRIETLEAALERAMHRLEWMRQRRAEAIGATPEADDAAAVGACPTFEDEVPDCPDLFRRQILCVGGRVRLVPRYRDLVQAANGAFSYHDGGIEDHMSRLPALLAAADGVVCLAGDVSHGAYHLVKRYCKRAGKPCALVKHSGVGALSRCLAEIAGATGSGQMLPVAC